MSAASRRDAMEAQAQDFVAHINAYYQHADHYADAMIRREKLRGYSDDANRAQEDRERMEYNRRMK